MKEVLLTIAHNAYELSAIEGILKSNDILYILKDQSVGGLLRIGTGSILKDVYVYVSEFDYEKSKDLMINIGIEIN